MSEHHAIQGPAATYKHDHAPVQNVNDIHQENQSSGQRIADKVAGTVGSWPFIIIQSVGLFIWMGLNIYLAGMEHAHPGFLKGWDPYPFILLNLVLSFQAAYTGPVVMMSQNRQSEKDRLMAQSDFECNMKAEEEIKVIMEHLHHQDKLTVEVLDRLARLEILLMQNAEKRC